MEELIEYLIAGVVLLIYIGILAITGKLDKESSLTEEDLATNIVMGGIPDNDLKTQADINYRRAVNKRKKYLAKKKKRFAVMCPNCGAPLETIYTRCKYCDMSYKEASDLVEKEEGADGIY